MDDEMTCPKCGEECCRDSADVGVGVIYGPWGCICGWSSDPHYDASNGPSPAQLEAGDGRWVDSTGCSHSVARIADDLERFKIPRAAVEDVFRIKTPGGPANVDQAQDGDDAGGQGGQEETDRQD